MLKAEVNKCNVDMVEFVIVSTTLASVLRRVTAKNDKFDADNKI